MTNEEAIKILKQFRDRQGNSSDDNEAFDMAIKALEQQPCDDCISRKDTLDKINTLIAEYIPLMPIGWTLPLNIAKTINELPSVTPQRKVGKWDISTTETLDGQGLYECSVCGHLVFTRIYNNYCPNCGADMRESEGEE